MDLDRKDDLSHIFNLMRGAAKEPGARIATHLPVLYSLARNFCRNGLVVECGIGCSTVALLTGVAHETNTLFSIDISSMRRERVLELLAGREDLVRRWIFEVSDSAQAAARFDDDSVGLLFIDTDHTYATTRDELDAWLPKMAPGGVICGHDWFPNENEPRRAVSKAVLEFEHRHSARFKLQILEHDEGLFILWPK